MGRLGSPLPSDTPIRMTVDLEIGDCKTRVSFGVKHGDEHARDALPILHELLTGEETPTVEGEHGRRIAVPSLYGDHIDPPGAFIPKTPSRTSKLHLTPLGSGEPEPMLCGADMGDDVTCERPLEELHDPLGWRCGWGHQWWFWDRVDGMFRYRGDVPLGTLVSDTQQIALPHMDKAFDANR